MPFIVPTPLGATAASTGSWTDLAASQFFVVQERAGAANSSRSATSLSVSAGHGSGPGVTPGSSAHSGLDGPVRHPIILASPAASWPTQLAVAIVQCSYRILVKPTAQGPRIVIAIADNRPAILADWLIVELQLFPRALALEPGTPLTPIQHTSNGLPALHRSGSAITFSDFDFRLIRLVTEFVVGDQQLGGSRNGAPASELHSSSDSPTRLPRSSPRHLSFILRRYLETIELPTDCYLVAHSDCTVVDTWADETAPYPATILLSRHHWVVVPWPDPDDGTLPLPNESDLAHDALRCPFFCVSSIVPDPRVSSFASPSTALGSTASTAAGVSVPCTLSLSLAYDATCAPPTTNVDNANTTFKLQLVFPSPEIVQVFMVLVQDSLYNLARSTETRTTERDARHRLGGDLGFSLSESQSNDSLASPSALRPRLPNAKVVSKAPVSRLLVPRYKSSTHLMQLQRIARLSRLFGVQFQNDEEPLEFPVRIWVTSKFTPASPSSLVVPVWSGAELSLITGPGTAPGSSPSTAPIVYRMTMWVMSDCLLFLESDPTKSVPLRLHLPFLELATVSKIPHGPTSWGITAALWGSISTLAFLLRSRAGRTWGIEVVEPSHASALYDVIMGRLRQVRLPPLPVTPTSAPLTPASVTFSSPRDVLGFFSLPTPPPPIPDSASALSGSFSSLSVAAELDVCNTPLDFLFPSLDPRSSRHEKHLSALWESFSKSVLLHAPHVELGPHLFALFCGGIVDRQLSSEAAAALAGEGAGSTLVTYDGLLVPSTNASTDSLPSAAPPNRLRNRRTVIGFPCSMRQALWSLLARRAADLTSSDVFDPVTSPFPGTGPNARNPHHHQDGWSFSDFQARPRRKSTGDALSIGGHIPPLALVREYPEYVKLGPHPDWEEEIEKDVHRSLPEHPAFETNGIGQSALRRVLHAFSHRNPAVGYAQAMNLIACQLLRACGEAQAFAALCWITEYLMPTHFTRTLLGALVDQQVFEMLLLRFLPKVSAKLQTMHTGIAAITISWFLSAFMSVVPSNCALVVLDGVFLDRERFVFLLAVGIVGHLEDAILKAEDELHMMVLIRDFFKLFEDVDAGVYGVRNGSESDGDAANSTSPTSKGNEIEGDDTQLLGLALLQTVIITAYTRFGPLLTHDTIAELRDSARFAAVHKLEFDFRKAQLRTISAQAGLPSEEAELVYTHFQWTILTKGQTPGMLNGAGATIFMARACKWASVPGPLEVSDLPDFGTLILRFQLGNHRHGGEPNALGTDEQNPDSTAEEAATPVGLDFAGASAAYRDLTRGSSSKRLRFLFALHDLDRDGVLDAREADLLMYHLAWFLGGGKHDWDALQACVAGDSKLIHHHQHEELSEVGMCLWNIYHALSSTTAAVLTQEANVVATDPGHVQGMRKRAESSVLGLGTGVSLNAFLLALSVDPLIVEKMHFYS